MRARARGSHLRQRRHDRSLHRRRGRRSRSLDVHPLTPDEPYYLGMFLNGAYQEILGDLHNLFGDTNAVHVRLTRGRLRGAPRRQGRQHLGGARATWSTTPEADGRSRAPAGRARRAERASSRNEQMRTLMQHYEQALRSYTYLTDERVRSGFRGWSVSYASANDQEANIADFRRRSLTKFADDWPFYSATFGALS